MKKIVTVLAIACFGISVGQNFKVSKKISVAGDGGWDYLTVDNASQHLFVSHGDVVNVIDLKTDKTIATIQDTKGVHGIAIVNDFNKAFITCGKDNTISVVDLTTFVLIEKVKIEGQKPDAIIYNKFSKYVFSFNGKSNDATVLDAKTNKIVKTISFGGKPEFAVTNGNNLLYVNVKDKNEIKTVDTKTLEVTATFSVAPGNEPTGLAIDTKAHRLFSVCGNKMMLVLDSKTGKLIQNIPIGDGCDGVIFDAKNSLVFTSNGEGTMTVVKKESANKFTVVQTLVTQKGAKTIAINPTSKQLYMSTPEFGAKPEPTAENPKPRADIVPNSFTVLVVENMK